MGMGSLCVDIRLEVHHNFSVHFPERPEKAQYSITITANNRRPPRTIDAAAFDFIRRNAADIAAVTLTRLAYMSPSALGQLRRLVSRLKPDTILTLVGPFPRPGLPLRPEKGLLRAFRSFCEAAPCRVEVFFHDGLDIFFIRHVLPHDANRPSDFLVGGHLLANVPWFPPILFPRARILQLISTRLAHLPRGGIIPKSNVVGLDQLALFLKNVFLLHRRLRLCPSPHGPPPLCIASIGTLLAALLSTVRLDLMRGVDMATAATMLLRVQLEGGELGIPGPVLRSTFTKLVILLASMRRRHHFNGVPGVVDEQLGEALILREISTLPNREDILKTDRWREATALITTMPEA